MISWREELELENGIVFFLVGENRATTTLQLQLMTTTNRSAITERAAMREKTKAV